MLTRRLPLAHQILALQVGIVMLSALVGALAAGRQAHTELEN